jgi:hypothetical protein
VPVADFSQEVRHLDVSQIQALFTSEAARGELPILAKSAIRHRQIACAAAY